MPYFLSYEKISTNVEPVYRMKQTISMVLSTLYMTVKPSKPFNPILGETYQGYLYANQPDLENNKEDQDAFEQKKQKQVFRVFAEQTSHHPPISNFHVENDLV